MVNKIFKKRLALKLCIRCGIRPHRKNRQTCLMCGAVMARREWVNKRSRPKGTDHCDKL